MAEFDAVSEFLANLSAPVCVCIGRTIHMVNRPFATLFGAPVETFTERDFGDLLAPEYRAALEEGLGALADESPIFPVKLARADGTPFEGELRTTRTSAVDGGVIVEIRDITRETRRAAEVVEREVLLDEAMRILPDGLITFDGAGLIEKANEEAERVFGYSDAELCTMTVDSLIAEMDADDDTGFYFMVAGGDTRTVGIRRDGTVIPLDVTVKPVPGAQRELYLCVVRDMSSAQRHERARLELARTVFDCTSEAIMVTDTEGTILAVNPAFSQITGWSQDDAIGRTPTILKSHHHDETFYQQFWTSLKETGRWEGEIWNRRKNGETFLEWLSVTATHEDGDIKRYVAIFRDITKVKEDEERIRYQANFDPLTGLGNRSLFLDRLTHSVASVRRQQDRVILMFLDLDGFKMVNDTLGHDQGDLLLQETARRLETCVRTSDTVCRLGGDEFTIILVAPPQHWNGELVAQRILDELSRPFKLGDHEAHVSASIGITVCPEDSTNPQELLKNADIAMYRAKEKGKANYQFFTPELNKDAAEKLALRNGLIKALANDDFELYFQPKVGIADRRVLGAESLLRWHSPTFGWVPPVKFIPVLEESGLIREVGKWVFRNACRQYQALCARGFDYVRIAINLSPAQILQPDIIDVLRAGIEDAGIDPRGIELEITESLLMKDPQRSERILRDIKGIGISLAMDDFGTGYSSLNYLKNFPIDIIKIDKSFISGIPDNAEDLELTKAIVNMGHALGRRIVAEGVETEEQFATLKDLGCHEIQGFLISRPVNVGEFMTLIEKDARERR